MLGSWPRCLLWHGWLPGLYGVSTRDPWATSSGDLASFHLEQCLGAYPVDFDNCWAFLSIVMLMRLPWKCRIIPMSGLMEAGRRLYFCRWV